MTMSTSAPNAGAGSRPHEREAQTLTGWLRTGRLTVLHGAAGAGKTELLRNGVLARLHRRASDVAVPHGPAPRTVIEFPDRRRGAGAFGGGRSAEVAVFFDRWADRPLAGLTAAIHAALGIAAPGPVPPPARPAEAEPDAIVRAIAESPVFDVFGGGDTLAGLARRGANPNPNPPAAPGRISLAGSVAALNMQFGARFLLVLDRFEECLAAVDERPDARDLVEELVQALNRPLLPLNVLLSVRDEARPRLAALFGRVPGFDERTLPLAHGPARRPAPPVLRQVPVLRRVVAAGAVAPPSPAVGPAAAGSRGEAAARPSPEAADWYAEIGSIVARAAGAAHDDAGRTAAAPAPGAANSAGVAAPTGDMRAEAPTLPGGVASAAAAASMRRSAIERAVDRMPAPPAPEPAPTASAAPTAAPSMAVEEPDAAARAPAARALPTSRPAARSALPAADPRPTLGAAAAGRAPAPAPRASAAEPTPATRPPRPAALVWAGAPLLLALFAYALWPSGDIDATDAAAAKAPAAAPGVGAGPAPQPTAEPAPTTAATSAATSAPAPAPAAAPAVPPGTDNPQLVAELAAALGGASPAASPPSPWPDGFVPVPGQPQLAVARYDALQAAKKSTPGAALKVVTPLYTEELYFVARADSPLTDIHDLRGAAIDAGPADGPRGVTAAAIHQRLFGAPLPPAPRPTQGAAAALGDLAAGNGPDVVLVVGAQPADWQVGLPPATAQALKPLRLDRDHPADRRVLQTYLPARLPAVPDGAGAPATPTLAVLSFLVGRDDAGRPAPTARAAESLCAALPELRRSGHPKWRELALGLALDAGWPVASDAAAAFGRCTGAAPR